MSLTIICWIVFEFEQEMRLKSQEGRKLLRTHLNELSVRKQLLRWARHSFRIFIHAITVWNTRLNVMMPRRMIAVWSCRSPIFKLLSCPRSRWDLQMRSMNDDDDIFNVYLPGRSSMAMAHRWASIVAPHSVHRWPCPPVQRWSYVSQQMAALDWATGRISGIWRWKRPANRHRVLPTAEVLLRL